MAFGVSATCGPCMGRQPFTELNHTRISLGHICFYYLAHFMLGYGTVLVQFWLKRCIPVLHMHTRNNLGHILAVDLGQKDPKEIWWLSLIWFTQPFKWVIFFFMNQTTYITTLSTLLLHYTIKVLIMWLKS